MADSSFTWRPLLFAQLGRWWRRLVPQRMQHRHNECNCKTNLRSAQTVGGRESLFCISLGCDVAEQSRRRSAATHSRQVLFRRYAPEPYVSEKLTRNERCYRILR